MAEERNERQTVREIALQSLKNELDLATKLLREVREAREVMAMEPDVIGSARNAFRHAVDALDRMPQLAPEDMESVQKLIDEFRATLAQLES